MSVLLTVSDLTYINGLTDIVNVQSQKKSAAYSFIHC